MSQAEKLRRFVWSREFYELMQTYRHSPLIPQVAVSEAFEAVKTAIVKAVED